MTKTLRFGWYIPTHGDGTTVGDPKTFIAPDMDLFVRVAKAAEEAGFEYCLVPVLATCWDAWIVTSMVSAATERITMLVAARPGLVAPTLQAKMIATFDQMSRGRIYVNLIAGGGTAEMAADGVFLAHDERYEAIDESVRLMKAVWAAEGAIDWDGKHYRVEGAFVRPRTFQRPHPPFYIGGISPAAIETGAQHADVYMLWGNTPAQIAKDIAAVREQAARFGRAERLRFCMRLQVLVRETEAEAKRDAMALIATATEKARASRLTGVGAESHADGRMREFAQTTAANDYWILPNLWAGLTTVRHGAGVMMVGTGAQVAELIDEYVAAGCTEFCLSGYTHDAEAERFGRMVVPYFRERIAEPRFVAARREHSV